MSRRSRVAGRWLLAFAVVGISTLVALPAAAQVVVSVEELEADPEAYDGETVTLQGELIGDYGFRSDGSMWTQLNDDSYVYAPVADGGDLTGPNHGVGVRMPSEIAESLDPPGGYRRRGPVVQATGVWKYHDADRGGSSYLDVSAVETVAGGEALEAGIDWWALAAGIVLLGTAAGLWVVYVRARDLR
jgi:hypothetical protein